MRKIYLLATILIAALIAGCNNDVLVEEAGTINKGNAVAKTIKLSASMPNGSNSRVSLGADDNGINLKWKAGDKIYLIFAQDGSAVGKQLVTLTENDITNEGRNAKFDINVPATITAETFTLYGVHGGGGFVDEASYELKLPTASETIGASLQELSDDNAVMIKFKAENVSATSPEVSVTFENIGSAFKVVFTNNSGHRTHGHLFVNFIATSSITVNQPNGEATFNPLTGGFTNLITKNNLPLADGSFDVDLNNGDKVEFWGWYIPQEGESCPEFRLNVRTPANEINITTTNTSPERENGFSIGKGYRFFVSYDGSSIALTNSDGIAEYLYKDKRDGNVYKYATIGDQVWLAENLRYIPEGATLGNSFRIMNYNGTDIEEAKGTDEYKTFGVYYNWITAVAGTDNSSGKVQGVCPDGWHVPQMDEVASIIGHVTNGNFLKKAETEFWNTNNGTDHYGFTAFGGGYYENDVLQQYKYEAAFWTSFPQVDIISKAHYFHIGDNGHINTVLTNKANHLNVRCIRDTSSGGVDQ